MAEATDVVSEIEGLLTAQLEQEKTSNRKSMRNGGILIVIALCYLSGMSWVASQFLDPEGLALAAAGAAVDAVPAGAQQVRALVVDGAPDLARMGAQQVISQIPAYRQSLEGEIDPVIDQVCGVLADTAVKKMASETGDPKATNSDDAALDKAADAAVTQLDAALKDAMDAKDPDNENETPRHVIQGSLVSLKHIDVELQRVAKNGGDPAERDLLLAWLNVLSQAPETKIEQDDSKKPHAK